MIKLNDYLVHFPVLDGVTTTKTACKEFVDVLEDRAPSSTLEEFLDVCVHLEEAELQKSLKKKIASAMKEHDDLDGKKKRQEKPKLRHERHHGLGKCHQSQRKKKFCDYHGLCYHDTD
eukprot:9954376-Ditylum_brightwellii.AAC.1